MNRFKILTQQDLDVFIQALCRFVQKTETLLLSLDEVHQHFIQPTVRPLRLSAIVQTLEDGAAELRHEIDTLEAAATLFLGESRQPMESVPVYVLRISLILNDPELLRSCLRRNNRMLV